MEQRTAAAAVAQTARAARAARAANDGSDYDHNSAQKEQEFSL